MEENTSKPDLDGILDQEGLQSLNEKLDYFWNKWRWIKPFFIIMIRFLLLTFLLGFVASLILFAASFFTDKISYPWYQYLILAFCFWRCATFVMGIAIMECDDLEIISSNHSRILYGFSEARNFIFTLSFVGFAYFNEALWFHNGLMYLFETLIFILCAVLVLMCRSFDKHVAGNLHTLALEALTSTEKSMEKIFSKIDGKKE